MATKKTMKKIIVEHTIRHISFSERVFGKNLMKIDQTLTISFYIMLLGCYTKAGAQNDNNLQIES